MTSLKNMVVRCCNISSSIMPQISMASWATSKIKFMTWTSSLVNTLPPSSTGSLSSNRSSFSPSSIYPWISYLRRSSHRSWPSNILPHLLSPSNLRLLSSIEFTSNIPHTTIKPLSPCMATYKPPSPHPTSTWIPHLLRLIHHNYLHKFPYLPSLIRILIHSSITPLPPLPISL